MVVGTLLYAQGNFLVPPKRERHGAGYHLGLSSDGIIFEADSCTARHLVKQFGLMWLFVAPVGDMQVIASP